MHTSEHMAPISSTAAHFFELGLSILKQAPGAVSEVRDRSFQSYFCVTAFVVDNIWKFFYPSVSQGAHPKHLLWMFFKIETFASDYVCACVLGGEEKNVRK